MNATLQEWSRKVRKARSACRAVGRGLCAGFLASLLLPASADVITWTGAGNGVSLFESNNWDNGGVLGVTNFKDIPVAHDFVVNDGAATVGGAGGVNGTFDLGGTGSLTVSAGAFKMGAGAIIKNGSATFGNTTGANSQLQGVFDNVDAYSNWGTGLIGGLNLVNGTVFDTVWFHSGSAINSSLDGSSTLKIREDQPGTYGSNLIDFLDGSSTIVYTDLGRTIADVTSEHLANFRVGGAPAVLGGNLQIFTNGDGFTTVQAIPEPGPLSLLLGGGLFLYLLNTSRKRAG